MQRDYDFKPLSNNDELLKLQEQLQKDGYVVTFNNGVFRIGFSENDLEAHRTRGAGRKHKRTDYNMREMYLYRQNHSQKQAAELLNVSLRTYQRMEKSAKDAGFWNDTEGAADVPFERIDSN